MSKLEELEKKYKKLGEEIEQLKNEKLKTKLYDLVTFSGYEWYVIAEDDDKLTLFMKDKFTSEICEIYFVERILDINEIVGFSYYHNVWWKDSPIRMALNSGFLRDLEMDKLKLMETTVSNGKASSTTEDYVRLITEEEVRELPIEIRKCSGSYGYWTMSPFNSASDFNELYVSNTGVIGSDGVAYWNGVRPVICVKKSEVKYE